MGFLPTWLNPFDVIIAFALLAGIAYGFIQGLVRMALGLLVLYLATVLAMTLYIPVGGWIRYLTGGALSARAGQALAFGLILILFYALVTFILRRTYRDTELPGIRQMDQIGGMVLGFFLTTFWIGLALIAVSFVLKATDVAASALRENLLMYFRTSHLIPIFYRLFPILLATLRPWMPKGLSPDIFTRFIP